MPQTCTLGLFDAGHLEERVMNLLEKTNCTSKIW
jgi:hypothetical protein